MQGLAEVSTRVSEDYLSLACPGSALCRILLPEIDFEANEAQAMETNTTTDEPRLRNVMCVYSQPDEPFYLQLKKSLNLWERQGHVRWLELRPGDELAATWQSYVRCADLILLLLSPDFFADELCYQTMHLALQERTSRQVPVVPILIRAVNWRLSACKDLAILPHNEQPVASWTLIDEAYASIGADFVRLVPGWPSIPLPTRPRLFQARDLPKSYVPRPKAFDEIKHLLLNRQSNQTAAITTALRGAGGFGKTTLALALCHDRQIQAAFPDGILWVELGEQPPGPLDLLLGVLASLEPSLKLPSSGSMKLEEARDLWRTTLDRRACLLVIDDVWQAVALSPLLEGGPHCVRLVTTRNDQVLPEESARIFVDAMEIEEAVAMLCRGLPEEVPQSALEALVIRLGCWPLLLTLAHGLLADQVRYGRTMAQALEVVEHIYQQRGVTAFHLEQVNKRYQTVERCLEVSLRHLEEFTLPRYQAASRYQELVIFPEDMDIPIVLLRIFWQGTGGLERWETDELCVRLHQLSLLLTCDLGKGIIRLHDVMRNYLVQRADMAGFVHIPVQHDSAYQKSEREQLERFFLDHSQALADTKLSTLHAHFSSILLMRRAIYIGTPIDDNVANLVVGLLLYLQSEDATKDISMYIYINSPGSIYAGLAIYDTMQWLRPDVSTICVGQAIGFGAILLSAGTKGKRFALPGSTIGLRQPLGGAEGTAAEIEITAREILRLRRTLVNTLAKHTGQSPESILHDMDRTLRMNTEDAVSYGIVDAAIS